MLKHLAFPYKSSRSTEGYNISNGFGPMAPNLHTKTQGHKIFKIFLLYMGVPPFWSSNPDAADELSFLQPIEAACNIWL